MFLNICQPFNLKMFNIIEVYNEITILICSYFCFLFTGIVDVEMRYKLGWAFIGIVTLNISVNIGAIILKLIFTLI